MEIIRLSIYHTVNADTLSAVVFPYLSPQVLSTNFPISYMIHEYSLFWKMSSKKEYHAEKLLGHFVCFFCFLPTSVCVPGDMGGEVGS